MGVDKPRLHFLVSALSNCSAFSGNEGPERVGSSVHPHVQTTEDQLHGAALPSSKGVLFLQVLGKLTAPAAGAQVHVCAQFSHSKKTNITNPFLISCVFAPKRAPIGRTFSLWAATHAFNSARLTSARLYYIQKVLAESGGEFEYQGHESATHNCPHLVGPLRKTALFTQEDGQPQPRNVFES